MVTSVTIGPPSPHGVTGPETTMELTGIIYVALLLYLLVIGTLIRVFQVIRKRDELMRVITAQWIQESSSPLSPDPK